MKTTKKQFEFFKSECEKWIDKLSLRGWQVDYEHKKMDDVYARTTERLSGRIAVIQFNTEWYDKTRPLNEITIAETAKHEVIHLLLGRLYICALSRFVSESELGEAEEEVVRHLEHIL